MTIQSLEALLQDIRYGGAANHAKTQEWANKLEAALADLTLKANRDRLNELNCDNIYSLKDIFLKGLTVI